jgi:hypothetical protein
MLARTVAAGKPICGGDGTGPRRGRHWPAAGWHWPAAGTALARGGVALARGGDGTGPRLQVLLRINRTQEHAHPLRLAQYGTLYDRYEPHAWQYELMSIFRRGGPA